MRYLAVVLVSALACGSAFAQWQWIDASGRKVYSDTAPPRSIPDKSILKRPGAPSPLVSQESATQAEPVPAANPVPVAQPSGVDPKLEAKRKEAEKEEAAKRQAETDKRNQARLENCERAKRSLATLKSGIRIRTTNAKGESVYIDDAARAVETKRIESIVQSDCGLAPVRPVAPVQSGSRSVP
ncbi:DUF4124 domain-containing protein [Hydrogenophaga crassostreae]|nr:DUF4124 domain-containing protein [Hydrogenophaga crassostreae]AOW15585.1 hypothetical protein LPB072_11795 [Hydrogenophaga crassostreae]